MQKKDVNKNGLAWAHKVLRGSPRRLYFVVPATLFHEYRMVAGVGNEVEQWVLKMAWV
jgi:hypothetical protein